MKTSQDKLLSWGSQPNYQELKQAECIQGDGLGGNIQVPFKYTAEQSEVCLSLV